MKDFFEMLFKNVFFWVFLLILIIFLFFKDGIRNAFGGLFNQGLDYDRLNESGSTISGAKARELAERIHKYMTQWGGTNELGIYKAFDEIITYGDFAKVYNVFGQRPYDDMFGVASTESLGENIDLFGWLTYELSESEYEILVADNPEIFNN